MGVADTNALFVACEAGGADYMLRERQRSGRLAPASVFAGLPFGFPQGKKACASAGAALCASRFVAGLKSPALLPEQRDALWRIPSRWLARRFRIIASLRSSAAWARRVAGEFID